ncbi:hypothetical protein N7495_001643 [Penicillium taxi]|uniref:uncharacterized protein n=1 Tax=Penicillium taxi TaxID=168475 RepID=UPI002545ABA3|nr:uncharacterized protein N7495_001643 [Penicillium taxi]KAJ5908961.1 hypothetical protein N7495_001643 [Penicillium taxi]
MENPTVTLPVAPDAKTVVTVQLQGQNDAEEAPPVPKRRGSTFMSFVASILGSKSPVTFPVDPLKNNVWLLDNTAYQSITDAGQSQWHAEVVACIFEKEGRKEIDKLVIEIASYLGLDPSGQDTERTRQRIAHRVQPFLDFVSLGGSITLDVKVEKPQSHQLGPSDRNGIITQTIELDGSNVVDGTVVQSTLQSFHSNGPAMATRFAAPEGWIIISDIDDTIKHTMTMQPSGILRTTFVEEPVPIEGMPDFYQYVQKELHPAWFYLSASPYNLYPFLHKFLHENYCPGTLLLRDDYVLNISGLIKVFTANTQQYKVGRMDKIHEWFPKRRVLAIGDSTQRDPEAYAEIYRRYPGWIHAICIRKVFDVANMDENNKPERFEAAFKDVPDHAWTVFEDPKELYSFVDGLGMEDLAL